jgi:hypothetical protein
MDQPFKAQDTEALKNTILQLADGLAYRFRRVEGEEKEKERRYS